MFPTQSIPHNLKTNPAEDEANPAEDERGITLQTLIVTAVLVLMAVATGVIVVAITSSASDDLEEQSPDLEARCAPWEIFDPELAAAGAGGGGEYTSFIFPDQANVQEAAPGEGGVTSSKVGCLPVCYFELNDTEDDTLDEALAVLDEDGGTLTKPERSHLKFDTSNRPPERFEIRIGVTYTRQKAAEPASVHQNIARSGLALRFQHKIVGFKHARPVGYAFDVAVFIQVEIAAIHDEGNVSRLGVVVGGVEAVL